MQFHLICLERKQNSDSVVEWGVGAQVEEDLVVVVAEVDDIK